MKVLFPRFNIKTSPLIFEGALTSDEIQALTATKTEEIVKDESESI